MANVGDKYIIEISKKYTKNSFYVRSIDRVVTEKELRGLERYNTSHKNTKPAHWYINPDGYYPQCSNCGYEPPRELIRRNGDALIFPRHCPECGADTKREVK